MQNASHQFRQNLALIFVISYVPKNHKTVSLKEKHIFTLSIQKKSITHTLRITF